MLFGKTGLLAAVGRSIEHWVNQSDAISERATQVLSLVAAGKRNKEIASDLSIAEDTVKMHVRNIFSTLDAPIEPKR